MTEIRHLVSIDDLSLGEMEALFLKAREISEDLTGWAHLCQGAITATLFYRAFDPNAALLRVRHPTSRRGGDHRGRYAQLERVQGGVSR